VNDLRDVIRGFIKERDRERFHSPKMKIARPRVHGAPCVRSSITDSWLGPGFSTAGVVVSNSKERVGAVALPIRPRKPGRVNGDRPLRACQECVAICELSLYPCASRAGSRDTLRIATLSTTLWASHATRQGCSRDPACISALRSHPDALTRGDPHMSLSMSLSSRASAR
jgi:hypothetical protein